MQFSIARKKLGKIAGNKHHSISYQMSLQEGVVKGTECWLYIATTPPISSGLENTFEEAFTSLGLEISRLKGKENAEPKDRSIPELK